MGEEGRDSTSMLGISSVEVFEIWVLMDEKETLGLEQNDPLTLAGSTTSVASVM